jgi:hypothetical protein
MIAESPLARKIMEEKSEEIKAQTIPLEAKEATIYIWWCLFPKNKSTI